ncbi:MAG: AI-2E family transporter [Planctomycetota bacterium]|jgi:predicted PurR-regulated permease PerM|nr:AI-2E family transporter [Planctomycetota bacterium]
MQNANRTQIALLALTTTILVGWVLHVGASILQPLVIAFLLASMLQPVVQRLAGFKIPPTITVVVLVALIGLGLAQGGLMLQSSIANFFESSGAETIVEGIRQQLLKSSLPSELQELIVGSLAEADMQGVAGGLIGGGVGFAKGLLLIMIYMSFIFAEQAIFKRKILSIAGDRQDEAAQMLSTMARGIQRYLSVKTVVSALTGSLCYLVLVMCDVPYALLFGLLTFMLNYIPTFGSIIAAFFPTVTALGTGSTWSIALIVMGSYLAINLTLGSYVEPKILGRELNLSPLVVVVSVVVWAGIWGVVGAFLAVPLTSAIQIMLLSSERTRPVAILLSIGPSSKRDKG